jgi:hypothetical protein
LDRLFATTYVLGKSPATVAQELYMKLPKITDKQSGNLVSAAQYTLAETLFPDDLGSGISVLS